jgi:hypothetical protein
LTPHFFAIVLVEQLRLALDQENIESRPLWKPMQLQPVFDIHRSLAMAPQKNYLTKAYAYPPAPI